MRNPKRQKLRIVRTFISFLLTITCWAYVLYQTDKCIKKYRKYPKSTDITIAKASKHDYPDLSFCDSDFSHFENALNECNLTKTEYKSHYNWYSNVSEECKDPKKLYLKITGKPSDFIRKIDIKGSKNVTALNLDDQELFEKKAFDASLFSRCFSLKLPKNIEITEISIAFKVSVYIFIQSSKSSLNVDKSFMMPLSDKSYIRTSILYDIFQVLDLDGQPCGEYENSRDDCLESEITKIVMENVGCTSPYHTNQSNICTDPEKGKIAQFIYFTTFGNKSFASIVCPKTCKFQVISLSNYEKKTSNFNFLSKTLKIKFEEFIKVSTSSPSYTFLELMAEVGGYVGLFLGVSINQTIDLLAKLAMIMHSFYMKIQVKYFLK